MKSGEEPGQLSTSTITSDSVDGIITRSVRFNGFVEVNPIYFKKNLPWHDLFDCIHYVQVRELSPNEAVDALMARLSYSASIRAEVATRRCAEKLSALETMKVAATFSLLVVHSPLILYTFFSSIIMWLLFFPTVFQWFLGNYSYQAALSHTEAGLVNVLSSSSSLFTLVLAACLPSGSSDRFTLTKFIAVIFSIVGVVMVSLSDLKVEQSIPVGAGWALAGSMCYAAYLVLLKRKVDHEDKMSIPMFFGKYPKQFKFRIEQLYLFISFFLRFCWADQYFGYVARLFRAARNKIGSLHLAYPTTMAVHRSKWNNRDCSFRVSVVMVINNHNLAEDEFMHSYLIIIFVFFIKGLFSHFFPNCYAGNELNHSAVDAG